MNLDEIIAQLKTQYPTLKVGSDETGYIELSVEEYEKTIKDYAQNIFNKMETKRQNELADLEVQAKRETAKAKLQALGLDEDDLKALGL